MDRYSEYRDSGIEWIGEIPRHWSLGMLKHFCSHINKKRYPNDGDVKISAENVESGTGKVVDYYADYDHLGMEFQVGDTLLNKLRVYLAKVIFCERSGLSMSEMIVLRPLKFSSKFQFYLLSAQIFIDQLNSLAEGVKMPRVPIDGIMNSYVPVPLVDEQIQIARYLDKKTFQIDSLIEKLQQKIELLTEYRSALISQCVTKGLDPDVDMKDSEIEWIGEIPRHWSLGMLKHFCLHINKKRYPNNGDIKISAENVESGTGKVVDYYADYDHLGMEFQIGDILLNKLRVYLAKVVFCESSGLSMSEMIVLRPLKFSSKFQFYLLSANIFIDELNSLSEGVKMPRVPIDGIMNSYVPAPPASEQMQISQLLDKKTFQIDSLIEKLQQKIELHKEYRQSLISNVVTGNIRVLELAK